MYKHDKDYEKAGEIQTKIDECTKGIISLIVFYSKVTVHKAKGYYQNVDIIQGRALYKKIRYGLFWGRLEVNCK